MAINLPGELAWVLNMLGYDWPEIDEDELRRGAGFTRDFKGDLEDAMAKADAIINSDLNASLEAGTARSFTDAWDENSQGNIAKMFELLEPASEAMELFADMVEALKLKVIAELVITAAQLAAAAATALLTAGLSAAANVAIIFARKKALTFATNYMIEQLIAAILPMVIEPLTNTLMTLVDRMLDAPTTQGMIGDPREYKADLDALELVASDLDASGLDQERVTDDYLDRMSSLQIITGG
ncbi:hypothetical protein [uncultured Agrococcus sp.]|uniref:WXG100-like domain-containing protein n=1 Tax=uncultured Agrococcus sp. TaxID=382258 RepID=UPI0025E1DAF6|nr:hypothetical protein [uncultured Agrococcus sp.]